MASVDVVADYVTQNLPPFIDPSDRGDYLSTLNPLRNTADFFVFDRNGVNPSKWSIRPELVNLIPYYAKPKQYPNPSDDPNLFNIGDYVTDTELYEHTSWPWGKAPDGTSMAPPGVLFDFGTGKDRITVYNSTNAPVEMGAEPDGNFLPQTESISTLSSEITSKALWSKELNVIGAFNIFDAGGSSRFYRTGFDSSKAGTWDRANGKVYDSVGGEFSIVTESCVALSSMGVPTDISGSQAVKDVFSFCTSKKVGVELTDMYTVNLTVEYGGYGLKGRGKTDTGLTLDASAGDITLLANVNSIIGEMQHFRLEGSAKGVGTGFKPISTNRGWFDFNIHDVEITNFKTGMSCTKSLYGKIDIYRISNCTVGIDLSGSGQWNNDQNGYYNNVIDIGRGAIERCSTAAYLKGSNIKFSGACQFGEKGLVYDGRDGYSNCMDLSNAYFEHNTGNHIECKGGILKADSVKVVLQTDDTSTVMDINTSGKVIEVSPTILVAGGGAGASWTRFKLTGNSKLQRWQATGFSSQDSIEDGSEVEILTTVLESMNSIRVLSNAGAGQVIQLFGGASQTGKLYTVMHQTPEGDLGAYKIAVTKDAGVSLYLDCIKVSQNLTITKISNSSVSIAGVGDGRTYAYTIDSSGALSVSCSVSVPGTWTLSFYNDTITGWQA